MCDIFSVIPAPRRAQRACAGNPDPRIRDFWAAGAARQLGPGMTEWRPPRSAPFSHSRASVSEANTRRESRIRDSQTVRAVRELGPGMTLGRRPALRLSRHPARGGGFTRARAGPSLPRHHLSRNLRVSAPSKWRTRTWSKTSGAISRAFTPMRSYVLSTGAQWVMQPQCLQR